MAFLGHRAVEPQFDQVHDEPGELRQRGRLDRHARAAGVVVEHDRQGGGASHRLVVLGRTGEMGHQGDDHRQPAGTDRPQVQIGHPVVGIVLDPLGTQLGQSVLVVRGFREAADAALPAYERFLSGGGDVLRGFRVGYAAGDTLTAGSLELRTPITSPLRFARLGVSVFADAAAVYDVGSRLREQRFDRGIGAGVWAAAAVLRLNVAVARGLGYGMRVSVGATLAY